MTALSILRTALKEIRDAATNSLAVNRDGLAAFARAALEAAAKAPGLADDDNLIAVLLDVPIDARDAYNDMRAVLRAVDAYQRGGK